MGCQDVEAHLFWCVMPSITFATAVDGLLTLGIGKILKDEDTVASYKIKETDFVVCMVMKVCFREPWHAPRSGNKLTGPEAKSCSCSVVSRCHIVEA